MWFYKEVLLRRVRRSSRWSGRKSLQWTSARRISWLGGWSMRKRPMYPGRLSSANLHSTWGMLPSLPTTTWIILWQHFISKLKKRSLMKHCWSYIFSIKVWFWRPIPENRVSVWIWRSKASADIFLRGFDILIIYRFTRKTSTISQKVRFLCVKLMFKDPREREGHQEDLEHLVRWAQLVHLVNWACK